MPTDHEHRGMDAISIQVVTVYSIFKARVITEPTIQPRQETVVNTELPDFLRRVPEPQTPPVSRSNRVAPPSESSFSPDETYIEHVPPLRNAVGKW